MSQNEDNRRREIEIKNEIARLNHEADDKEKSCEDLVSMIKELSPLCQRLFDKVSLRYHYTPVHCKLFGCVVIIWRWNR